MRLMTSAIYAIYCIFDLCSSFDYRLPITDYWLLIPDYWLPITDYWLLITDYWLLITDYWLLTNMKCLSLLFTFLLICTSAHAQSRQLPLRSINYMSYFNKAEFDERFPGKPIKDKQPTEKGYYVVYHHESLVYYFGPDELKVIAEMYKRELDRVVGVVKGKRESLMSAKTYIVKLPADAAHAPSLEKDKNSDNEKSEEWNEKAERGEAAKPKPVPWWKRLFSWFWGAYK